MGDHGSSPRRRTKKAATRRRSTTSSTTGPPAAAAPPTPQAQLPPEAAPPAEPPLLDPEQQHALWSYLLKGASPIAVCRELGVSPDHFWSTLQHDPQFAAALQRLFDSLSHNVLTALYQAAMKGNVTAQQFWLRQRPLAAWSAAPDAAANDDLEHMSDADLIELARAAGIDLPPEAAARRPPPAG